MKKVLSSLLGDIRGTSAVEYGIICGLIVIAMIAAFNGVAGATSDMWNDVSTKVQDASQ